MRLRSLLSSLTLVVTCLLTNVCAEARAQALTPPPTWGHGRIIERDGHSIFEVDGKPFFLYGAAFFYERLPRDRWPASMSELRRMGINTLDLYVPWNWHELSDGDFDFNGRTSPRRDFDEVLRLAKQYDFKIIVRPGPVVRNEWRNGGYPAWLLSRPEYGMPLHDLLEGRYPPTATLQNQHSDDAAAEWMRNTTHVTYAKRWLERVLHECEPYADRILAVALDDDQGAYIDNQTYPAPHFRAYLQWLRDVVHGVTGTSELTFINTYQMKVPASSPVWAMGNWYQSDAYSIGTHDESQLAFTFAQIATRPHQPLFASEFQAGWLQGAGEAYPRRADPSNTELALATMIGTGVRGVVNFPAQDTLNPTGWEAPFANFAYSWDAALQFDDTPAARYVPTAEFGRFVRTFGSQIAASSPRFDASILYPGTSVDSATARNTTFSAIASATIDAQQACRSAGFSCNLVDVGSIAAEESSVYFIPAFGTDIRKEIGTRYASAIANVSKRRKTEVRTITSIADVRAAMRGKNAIVENGSGAVFSEARSAGIAGFLSVTNYSQLDRTYADVIVHLSDGRRIGLPSFVVRAHSAIVSPVDADLAGLFVRPPNESLERRTHRARLVFTDCHFDSIDLGLPESTPTLLVTTPVPHRACSVDISTATQSASLRIGETTDETIIRLSDLRESGSRAVGQRVLQSTSDRSTALRPGFTLTPNHDDLKNAIEDESETSHVRRTDFYREGADSVVFDDASTELVVSPNAGARAFYAVTKPDGRNWFTTVGALRDDVAIEPPPSTSDRIAKYTHDFPAGTFNRPYSTTLDERARSATFAYTYPDAVPSGATIEKTVRSSLSGPGFDLDERMRFADRSTVDAQRGVSVESFALDPEALDADSLFAPAQSPIVAGTTRAVASGNAFAIRRGARCLVVAWHAGDIEATSLQERTDSIVARLTFAPSRTAHVIFREVPCLGDADPLPAVQAEAQRQPQVTPTPARTP